MPSEITMPQLSDTMSEGTLVKWKKKAGEKVSAGDEIADVETDKAVMPMEAFESGTLAATVAKEGEKVPVGGLLGVIALSGENVEDVKKQYSGRTTAQPSTPDAAPKQATKPAEKLAAKPAAEPRGSRPAQAPPTTKQATSQAPA